MKRLQKFKVNHRIIADEKKQKLYDDNIKATEYMALDAKNLLLGGLEDIRIYSFVFLKALFQVIFSTLLFLLSPLIIPIRMMIIWRTRKMQGKNNAK